MSWMRNMLPRVVALQSIKLLLHSRGPRGSQGAALAEAGSSDGAEVEAVQTNSSMGYRVDGREMPARARVTGPAPAGGGGSVGGVPVDEASPEAWLEGDVDEEEDDEAALESKLEGDAVPPEAALEGGEGAPELELEGVTGVGPSTTAGVSTLCSGEAPAGDGDSATCSCANGKQCSSK
jgi:hypothetical protein